MNKYLLTFCSCAVAALALADNHTDEPDKHDLDQDHHHGQHVHVHGEVVIEIAQEQQEIVIQLHSPAFNIVGFEHEPKNEADRSKLNIAAYRLKQLNQVLALPKQAGCKLISAEVDSILLDEDHGGHSHEEEGESDFVPHADFNVSYRLSCKAAELINGIEIKLFEQFRAVEKVELQWILKGHQGAATATPDNPDISI